MQKIVQKTVKEHLSNVKKIQKEIILLNNITALLNWDRDVLMPKKGIESRTEQLALVEVMSHQKFTSDSLYKSLKFLIKKDNFNTLKNLDKILVKKLYKDVLKARKLPESFVEELSRTTTKAHAAWEKAKHENNFGLFRPHLEKIVKLKRKKCSLLGYKDHPYNALLDDFEEGMTVEKLTVVFDNLKPKLVELLNKIKATEQYKKQKVTIEKKTWPPEIQEKIGREVIKRMGLSEDESRFDVYMHPFTTTIGNHDVRITTNYHKNGLFFAFFATVHEAGHALYELGFSDILKNTILHDAASFGLHESQSRIWEEVIAKSKPFWDYYFKIFKKHFPEQLKNINKEQFYLELNQVKPSLIRIFADEVTYCLHIILRFELERDLIAGKIKVKDLPKLWNAKMKELLGIMPKKDSEGVLQDVHWSEALFGYFPSYALGSIYASQLYAKMKQDVPSLDSEIKQGNFKPVLEWLRKNVHQYGSTVTAEEIVKKATGQGLNPEIFIKYLEDKYSKIYGF